MSNPNHIIKSLRLHRYAIIALLLYFTLVSCDTAGRIMVPSTQATIESTESATVPPLQGPAVIGDGIEIAAWAYLGPDADGSRARLQSLSSEVQEFGDAVKTVWLLPTEGGFQLEWGEVLCATEPIVIVHADALIEFWPGDIVGETCEDKETFHQLTVEIAGNVSPEQWEVVVHPPPMPDARNGS